RKERPADGRRVPGDRRSRAAEGVRVGIPLPFIALVVVLAVAGFSEAFSQRGQSPSQVEPLPEVPLHLQFVPSSVAERMLDLARVTSRDVVYDLGCGDGRVAILASKKFGARAVGVDV